MLSRRRVTYGFSELPPWRTTASSAPGVSPARARVSSTGKSSDRSGSSASFGRERKGAITSANLIVATTQNNEVLNRTVRAVAEQELTGRVEITTQNHGFVVDIDSLAGRARSTHVHLNDGTSEGLEAPDANAFSVQYHPEAAAGPHDALYLFERFRQMIGS